MVPLDQFVKSAWMLAATAVVVAALFLAKGVLVPLTLAVLLSFLLSPVCDWLERRKLGRIPAVLFTAVLGFAVLVAAWTAVVQMTALAPKMPEYQDNLQAKLHAVNDYFIAALNKVTRSAEDVGQNLPQAQQAKAPQGTDERPYSVHVLSPPVSPLQLLGRTFGTLVEVLGMAGIVVILVVFFLVRREDLRDRFIRLTGKDQATVTTQMLGDAATRVSRYLSMLFLINTAFGVAVGLGLYLIGVPNAILWGIMAATLRFVPFIGPWIAAVAPTDWLWPFPLAGGAVSHAGAVCRAGVVLWECPGTMALWQGHRRVGRGGPGGGRILDMAVGNRGTAAGNPLDRLPVGDRQARSATFLPARSAGERARFRAQAAGLSAAPGRRSRGGRRVGRR